MPAATSSIIRSIYFYRANVGLDEAGRPLLFDPAPVLEHLSKMPFEESGDGTKVRYMILPGDKLIACWVDKPEMPFHVQLGKIRRKDLPQLEEKGKLRNLNIPPDMGIIDRTHIVFFPENVVGVEYNHYGPRISQLSYYLNEKARDLCHEITFEAIMRPDVAADLDHLKSVQVLQLKLRPSALPLLAEAKEEVLDALKVGTHIGNTRSIELIIRAESGKRRGGLQGGLDIIKRILGSAGIQAEAETFSVKGMDDRTNRMIDVDFLSDKLVSKKRILRATDDTRAVDSEAAYRAIEEAYEESKEDIRAAPGILGIG